MLAVGEHFVLARQERATRIDEVHAGKTVLEGDLLRPQVFLDRERVVRSAFHGRVVRHDDALALRDAADAGDDPGRRCLVVVEVERGERRDLEERRARVEEPLHALARQQLARFRVLLARLLGAALAHGIEPFVQIGDEGAHRIAVAPRLRGRAVERRREDRHQCAMLNLSLRARL